MEILATLDDINANLTVDDAGVTVEATDENTALLQISAARIIRGYLARVIDNVTLQAWRTPDETPELIREVAGKLIASQLFFNAAGGQQLVIEDNHYAQRLYTEAMRILNDIISGNAIIEDVVIGITDRMSDLNFWPNDDTDRAFTMGMNL